MAPDALSRDTFWRAIKECMQYAYLAQEASKETQMPQTQANVFDEVDRAAAELANISNRDGSTFMQMNSPKSAYQWEGILTPHWTCTFRPEINDSFGLPFFSLAVRLNLYTWVNAKVRKGCIVKQDTGIWSLPRDAPATNSDVPKQFFERPFPSSTMVQSLLDNGADPNSKHVTATLWKTLLVSVDGEFRASSGFRESFSHHVMADWIEIIYLFLKYGAESAVELGPLGNGLRYAAVRASVKSEQGLHVKAD